MKNILKCLIASFLILLSITSEAVQITKSNGMGYSTTIESVVNNCNGTYTISLTLTHNGCGDPNCKSLSHLSIEALPGTYSNITKSVISGNFTGTLINGPNLGSDPFSGFKFDNVSGIGGGSAGSVRIIYTISGSLQSQRVSAKAGTSGNIVTFTVSDFSYVMINNSTNCNQSNGTDGDGDGCLDNDDSFPNDSTKCSSAIKSGTLAFEDLWPSKGDYDFNDMVVEYKLTTSTNSNNKVVDIKAEFKLMAFGAGFENGFGFQFPNSINQSDLSVTGSILSENIVSIGSNGLENSQSKPTFIVFDNTFSLMKTTGVGIGVNTSVGDIYVQPVTIVLNISVKPNTYTVADIGINSFNPFIFVNGVRSHEVHLPNYPPTSLANYSLFNTVQDKSVPSQGKYYVTEQNIPWVIEIPEKFDYPKEKVDIMQAHLKFSEWAQSNGTLFIDWYKNLSSYRNNQNIY
jgi:LruC domain-containing protein